MKYFYKFLLISAFLLHGNGSRAQNSFTGIIKYKREFSGSNNAGDSMQVVFDKHRVGVSFFMYDSTAKATREDFFVWDFRSKMFYSIDKYLKTYSVGPYEFGDPFLFSRDSQECYYDTLLCTKYTDKRKSLANTSFKRMECKVSDRYRNPGAKNLVFLSVQPLMVKGRIVLEHTGWLKNGETFRTYATWVSAIGNVAEYFSLKNLKKTRH